MDSLKFCNLAEGELMELLKERLNPHRFEHSLNVAERAVFLAEKYGADTEKACFAGICHDICKCIPAEEQRKIIGEGGIILDGDMLKSPALWHSVAGEIYIKKNLAVKDEDILNAVRYHTSGRANMSTLEKVIYVADLTSTDRNYPDAPYVRSLAEYDLNECLAFSVRWISNDLAEKGLPIGYDSTALLNETENVKITYTKEEFEKGK